METTPAYIYDAMRTPRGKGRPGGGLSGLTAIELMAALYEAAGERLGPELWDIAEDVILGCVTQTGEQGANIARTSALYAGLPHQLGGVTLNRFCASGLDAVAQASARVASGFEGPMVAGGVESISRVPMFSDEGAWFADPEVAQKTGFVQMGFAADLVASLEGFAREELDAWSAQSHQRAGRAIAEGYFARSLVAPPGEGGEPALEVDELVRPGTTAEGIAGFDPLFADERSAALVQQRYPELDELVHVHHRANSPSLADGAALVVVGARAHGQALGVRPRARVRAWATASVEPVVMLTAAQDAAALALERAGVGIQDIDRIELNEAFAAPVLKFVRDFEVDPERLNPNGGTIALGHAMGATGAILVGTLLDELERRDEQLGLVAISGGAGLGSALVIERV